MSAVRMLPAAVLVADSDTAEAWLAQSAAPLSVDRKDPGSIPGAVRSAG